MERNEQQKTEDLAQLVLCAFENTALTPLIARSLRVEQNQLLKL